MIYVSSSCVRAKTIKDSIEELVRHGFTNIELSGGTRPYEKMSEDLFELKSKYNLNYLLHNYFPPPQKDFVLNLASLDQEVSDMSLAHCLDAIDLSLKLDAKKFGVHAGFLINIPIKQIGKKIEKSVLFDESAAYKQFHKNIEKVINYAAGKLDIYIENNVLSFDNFLRFDSSDPFFFTSENNLNKIDSKLNYTPLIDVAHLKVSCNSLNVNFEENLKTLLYSTDYIHVSDNDGKNDQNKGLKEGGKLHGLLQRNWQKGKSVTLEVYEGISALKETHRLIKELER